MFDDIHKGFSRWLLKAKPNEKNLGMFDARTEIIYLHLRGGSCVIMFHKNNYQRLHLLFQEYLQIRPFRGSICELSLP